MFDSTCRVSIKLGENGGQRQAAQSSKETGKLAQSLHIPGVSGKRSAAAWAVYNHCAGVAGPESNVPMADLV